MTYQVWVRRRLLDEEPMKERVVKMYIHASLPSFPSENRTPCLCQSSPLVTLVALPGKKHKLVNNEQG